MSSLELKIPPPVIAAIVAAAMWGASRGDPSFAVSLAVRAAVISALALVGTGIGVWGAILLSRARTTHNPMKPEKASALVTSGIYRFTRNPMYVSLLMFLVGWAIYLASGWAFAGPLAFVLYMGRFQIGPEERVLTTLFGSAYADYTARVRRWL